MDYWWTIECGLLAQDAPAQGAQPDPFGQIWLMVPVLLLLLYFVMVVNPGRKDERQREERLKSLKKNDRVLTTGGIFGVVTQVQHDAQEVTIRVDENNNTRLRITLNSIARVLDDAPSGEEKEPSK